MWLVDVAEEFGKRGTGGSCLTGVVGCCVVGVCDESSALSVRACVGDEGANCCRLTFE